MQQNERVDSARNGAGKSVLPPSSILEDLSNDDELILPEPMDLDEDDTQPDKILEINDTLKPSTNTSFNDPRLRNKSNTQTNELKQLVTSLPNTAMLVTTESHSTDFIRLQQKNDGIDFTQSTAFDSSVSMASTASTATQPKIKFKIERKEGNCLNMFGRSSTGHKRND